MTAGSSPTAMAGGMWRSKIRSTTMPQTIAQAEAAAPMFAPKA